MLQGDRIDVASSLLSDWTKQKDYGMYKDPRKFEQFLYLYHCLGLVKESANQSLDLGIAELAAFLVRVLRCQDFEEISRLIGASLKPLKIDEESKKRLSGFIEDYPVEFIQGLLVLERTNKTFLISKDDLKKAPTDFFLSLSEMDGMQELKTPVYLKVVGNELCVEAKNERRKTNGNV